MGNKLRTLQDLTLQELEDLTSQELDEILEKEYGYGILGFYLVFSCIMRGFWDKDKNAMTKIKAYKKERDKLYKSFIDFKTNLARLCPDVAKKKSMEAIARRIVILDEVTSGSHLRPQKIPKSVKIAAVWAQVMNKDGKVQWGDIITLMLWFQFKYEKSEEGKILKKEVNSWSDSKSLARSYFHLKKNYKKIIEGLKNAFFFEDKPEIFLRLMKGRGNESNISKVKGTRKKSKVVGSENKSIRRAFK